MGTTSINSQSCLYAHFFVLFFHGNRFGEFISSCVSYLTHMHGACRHICYSRIAHSVFHLSKQFYKTLIKVHLIFLGNSLNCCPFYLKRCNKVYQGATTKLVDLKVRVFSCDILHIQQNLIRLSSFVVTQHTILTSELDGIFPSQEWQTMSTMTQWKICFF